MIEVTGLTKKYGAHCAVDDLSFTAEKGKIYGFLGPNGAGKSTTMNIMTGYLAATSGTVVIDGCDILSQPEEAKAKIGYLPEIPPLYPEMTVLEYLRFAAELKKLPADGRKEAVAYSMEKTGVAGVQNRLIRNLSKGYRQRVGLAQAIVSNPEIIILDEPTAGLDPEQQKEMFDYIRSLREEHIVILSSHILSDISAICDYIWILNKGRLVASDTTKNLRMRMTTAQRITCMVDGFPEQVEKVVACMSGISDLMFIPSPDERGVRFTLTSEADEDVRAQLSRVLVTAGMGILEMSRDEQSLEDVFLTLTS
ncbi:ABC transporter ATP-binding protein [Lachnoclostridium sp. Marseille-P6806]|uniref:ABC transporter ATP-binding protein n=1 Tax=Lachnoclostridium sp. Marseille-P6806 TaxID=2364793 RepID=UPI0010313B7D|nr:ABC transporter ATP-binding protein [Lachnoclostridium sp. Marseille-P6806]